jgi:acetyl-CoA carboxylase biotin carboxyl carrier protein
MDLVYLKKILKIVSESDVSELEISEGETKIRIVKNVSNNVSTPYVNNQSVLPVATHVPIVPHIEVKTENKNEEKSKNSFYYEVISPIVGTFYTSPSPEADPYVKTGQKVSKGTVLCIVEAMKLMNEIESEISGKVVTVCLENGQPVEYNQVLFLIEPDK